MTKDESLSSSAEVANVVQQQKTATLLPSPIANAVSLATRSTSFAIRLGSLVGAFGIDAARFTTLSSLELARGLVEVVLTRAGKDTTDLARSNLADADAENVLEKSLESLHYAVIQVVFWTSASFRLTSTTLLAASETSQLVLSSLDQLLGSTDSSRAVASIITLIRREFRNPATGNKGERVGVIDLVLALSALAYLQKSCFKITEEEQRRRGYEEVIWDVVVLNDGERIDVDDDLALQRGYNESYGNGSLAYTGGNAEEDEVVLARLKSQIVSSLPSNTTVSIANTVNSVQTITVDVDGPELLTLPTPPGAEIVETTTRNKASRKSWIPYFGGPTDEQSSYRVVYKIEREKFRSMVFQGDDVETGSVLGEIEDNNQTKPDIRFDAASGTFSSASTISDPTPNEVEVDTTPWDRAEAAEAVAGRAPVVGPRTSSYNRPTASSASKEPSANQKKQRSPPPLHHTTTNTTERPASTARKPPTKKKTNPSTQGRGTDKKGSLKQVVKGGRQSLSNMWNKDGTEVTPPTKVNSNSQWKAPDRGGQGHGQPNKLKPLPAQPSRNDKTTLANRRSVQTPDPLHRSSSRASYVSIQEHRRNSVVSQTDTFSINSGGLRPASPSIRRSDVSSSHGNTLWPRHDSVNSPRRSHRRNAPSIYSLATNDSQSSLIMSSYHKKSAYSAADALDTLRREGFVDGTFPAGHLLPNITRYMRFSSACYGSHFLKFMGISEDMPSMKSWDETPKDVRHFAHHTESDAGNILLASFVDPQGGTDSTGTTGTGVPLVHYISLDHEAKAVVLACRGTMGFEDVMTDMTCEYDHLVWRGRRYKVHKGMHASARRLLYGGDGRVLVTLKNALEEFPEYGLVLCGHSLGAGVTSLLGLMLSEPNPHGAGFVTATAPVYPRMLTEGGGVSDAKFSDIRVPSGRRIHVYAYGPPGVMSSPLRKITRGLVTSVVHGDDLVPHLSLGLLHDFQALALAFKNKENRTKAEIRARVWAAFQDNLSGAERVPSNDEHIWMLPALNALRDTMRSEKLLPPGEVFTIETQRVLRRDAFVVLSEGHLGRPALRVVLKYVRDVEGRFGEVRFGTSMLTDHSPANYENALNKLKLGVA